MIAKETTREKVVNPRHNRTRLKFASSARRCLVWRARRARTQKKTLSLTSLVSGSSSSRFRRPAAAYAAVQKGASRLPKMEHERLKPHMTDPAYYWVSSFHCPFSKTYRVMPKHRTRLVPASPGRVSPGPRSPGQRSPLHRRFAFPTNCRRAWLN